MTLNTNTFAAMLSEMNTPEELGALFGKMPDNPSNLNLLRDYCRDNGIRGAKTGKRETLEVNICRALFPENKTKANKEENTMTETTETTIVTETTAPAENTQTENKEEKNMTTTETTKTDVVATETVKTDATETKTAETETAEKKERKPRAKKEIANSLTGVQEALTNAGATITKNNGNYLHAVNGKYVAIVKRHAGQFLIRTKDDAEVAGILATYTDAKFFRNYRKNANQKELLIASAEHAVEIALDMLAI